MLAGTILALRSDKSQLFCSLAFLKVCSQRKSIRNKYSGKGKGKAIPLQAWTGP
jgi:hypothetical protein